MSDQTDSSDKEISNSASGAELRNCEATGFSVRGQSQHLPDRRTFLAGAASRPGDDGGQFVLVAGILSAAVSENDQEGDRRDCRPASGGLQEEIRKGLRGRDRSPPSTGRSLGTGLIFSVASAVGGACTAAWKRTTCPRDPQIQYIRVLRFKDGTWTWKNPTSTTIRKKSRRRAITTCRCNASIAQTRRAPRYALCRPHGPSLTGSWWSITTGASDAATAWPRARTWADGSILPTR